MLKRVMLAGVVCAALVWTAGPAQARSETQFRLLLGVVPGIDELTFENGGSATVDLDDQAGINLDAQLVLRTNVEQAVGFVGAAGFFLRTHRGEDVVGDEARLTVFGIHGAPGLSLNLSEQAALEFKLDLGLGVAGQEIDGFSDGTGGYASFGLSAGAHVKLSDTLLLVGEVGWLTFASTGEADVGFTTLDTEFKGSGASVNLGFGLAF